MRAFEQAEADVAILEFAFAIVEIGVSATRNVRRAAGFTPAVCASPGRPG